jgi:ABC-2 type transport system ATP-binding protein/ribosome-dependent ATPase
VTTSIAAVHLSRRFGEVAAVEDLSFSVEPGEVVGLLGANGAGKTTTMRMLLGLLAPTGGEALIAGQPVTKVDRRMMGYVPQGLGLYPDLTVAENVEFAAASFGVTAPSLTDEGLGAISNLRIGHVSLGLKRRVAFVVARCHEPSVLILDEPTSGVGPLGRARLWETIRETAERGAAVLVSTHYMEEAEECDRVVLMAKGKKVAAGSVKQVIGETRAVALSGDVTASNLETVEGSGGTVLMDGPGWRVVGLRVEQVREIVGPHVSVDEVPASFEEAFVALSR